MGAFAVANFISGCCSIQHCGDFKDTLKTIFDLDPPQIKMQLNKLSVDPILVDAILSGILNEFVSDDFIVKSLDMIKDHNFKDKNLKLIDYFEFRGWYQKSQNQPKVVQRQIKKFLKKTKISAETESCSFLIPFWERSHFFSFLIQKKGKNLVLNEINSINQWKLLESEKSKINIILQIFAEFFNITNIEMKAFPCSEQYSNDTSKNKCSFYCIEGIKAFLYAEEPTLELNFIDYDFKNFSIHLINQWFTKKFLPYEPKKEQENTDPILNFSPLPEHNKLESDSDFGSPLKNSSLVIEENAKKSDDLLVYHKSVSGKFTVSTDGFVSFE